MMRRFFISFELFMVLMLFSFFFIFFSSLLTYTVWIILFSVFLYLIRRKKITYKDHTKYAEEVLLSPVNGIVKNIAETSEHLSLEVFIPHLFEWGVYFPINAEIVDSRDLGEKRNLRYTRVDPESNSFKCKQVIMRIKKNFDISLKLLPCPTGVYPRVWVNPGDRGRVASCMGYMPFGGAAIVELPKNCNILVSIGDKLNAGETVIAGSM